MAANDETKIFPGNLERYKALRKFREELETDPGSEGHGAGGNTSNFLAAAIAEELAGLSYILDGIRYQTRQQR